VSSPFQSALVIGTAVAVAGATLAALLVTEIVGVTTLAAFMPQTETVIDPDVRALVAAGRARVLVVLRVDENSDPDQRADAISRAQDAVLSRLTRGHASVLRRYTSVPMLALEIDATALGALETMTDLVAGVKPDLTRRPQ
jgi:hypothetical protein